MSCLRRLPLTTRRTLFSFARKPRWHIPTAPSASIPQYEHFDEDRRPSYDPKTFYPAQPGEVLASRYQLLEKLGWGSNSTVWLREISLGISRLLLCPFRWQSESIKALKIIGTHGPKREKDIERHIAQRDPSHRGHAALRIFQDSFEVTSDEGKHSCLVYEPMREPFNLFQERFNDRQVPLPILKAHITILLWGLDYLHSECHVVHTDLKLDNILMSFENDRVLPAFIKDLKPMEYKINPATNRPIYRTKYNFGAFKFEDLQTMTPCLFDFGHSIILEPDLTGETEHVGILPIQSEYYRAPEVILGCGWDSKADIWICTELFTQVVDAEDNYLAKSHLAEMIALLGPPPAKLLKKFKDRTETPWPFSASGAIDKACHNMQEWFEGPFFNDDGKFLYEDLIPNRKLEDTIPFLEENERENFLSFARQMLTWQPKDRKTAAELFEHPFLAFRLS
ncbi:protein kinase [Aspergillus karnatakaensis]|uniref:putative serine/threonine-protein kinase n=1 Tax=Aspergillus karnatakaensis TaxID=1810916 RepID=UPI003CCCC17B